jgi:IPT/TIG domain/PASTA domain
LSRAFRLPVFLATLLAALAFTSGAQAAIVTVGSPLTGTFIETDCGSIPCVFADRSHPEAGATVSSPVDGAIVAWHIIDGTALHQYRLRVLSPAAGGAFTFSGTSAPEIPAGPQLETFPAALPIQAGQLIGIELELGGRIGSRAVGGAEYMLFDPPPADGATLAPSISDTGFEHGFNAEVQPAPTITAFGPTSGPISGGTTVTIGGTDFEGATAVKFGQAPAGFTVNSEGVISAVSPAGAAGSAPITVTTVAGTAGSSQQFTYQAPTTPTPVVPIVTPAPTCTVPKITGKKLKASKKKIRAADCKLGKVTKRKGATAKTGKVTKQSPKAGKVLAAGAMINVKLG